MRVRLHDLRSGFRVPSFELSDSSVPPSETRDFLARIEVGVAELPRLREGAMISTVTAALKALGFAEVAVDSQGYRRGSLNAVPAVMG